MELSLCAPCSRFFGRPAGEASRSPPPMAAATAQAIYALPGKASRFIPGAGPGIDDDDSSRVVSQERMTGFLKNKGIYLCKHQNLAGPGPGFDSKS